MENFFELKGSLKICVIGLGYVGLPLAAEFSKKYRTLGYDKNINRIKELIKFYDRTCEISSKELRELKNLKFITDTREISNCDIYIITVPTPVDKDKKPNLNPLSDASKLAGKFLNKGNIVIYESTVFPGATENFCVPILEKYSNLTYNKSFYCGYSPERINPGDDKHSLKNIVKVTSGSTKAISSFVDRLYKSIIPAGTHKASSISVAEASKVIENTQRDLNISLMNELSIIFNRLGLDTKEVLEAAGTKWNFLSFSPGLVGGHCIGVDPYYLTHRAIQLGYEPKVILAGRKVNDEMGTFIAKKTMSIMKENNFRSKNSRILILGLSFKENCSDLRNSKVPDIINYLNLNDYNILVSDHVANKTEAKKLYNIDLVDFDKINKIDVIILAVSHEKYLKVKKQKWLTLMNGKSIFIDVKSVLALDYFNNTQTIHWRL
jgi:UDP-N-acetyl-D-glucosamine/UDP-N-acetyl-D-galactosamine dehydrogenase